MSLFAILFSFFLKKGTAPFELTITGIQPSGGGQVMVAVFNSEATFLDEKKYVKLLALPVGAGQKTASAQLDLPSGDHAISAFHDENGNGLLDKNWLGIPVEAYGFSNGFVAKWGRPSWARTRFSSEKTGGRMVVNLEKW